MVLVLPILSIHVIFTIRSPLDAVSASCVHVVIHVIISVKNIFARFTHYKDCGHPLKGLLTNE